MNDRTMTGNLSPHKRLQIRVCNRLWRAGLTPAPARRGERGDVTLAEFPHWVLICRCARRWPLRALFEETALRERQGEGDHFVLITVSRRDGFEAATFGLELLEALLRGAPEAGGPDANTGSPIDEALRVRLVPRRRIRATFAHHRLLQALVADAPDGVRVPLLFSQQVPWPHVLVSLPLEVLKGWLRHGLPERKPPEGRGAQAQLELPLWGRIPPSQAGGPARRQRK